jgi:hypothetical protein
VAARGDRLPAYEGQRGCRGRTRFDQGRPPVSGRAAGVAVHASISTGSTSSASPVTFHSATTARASSPELCWYGRPPSSTVTTSASYGFSRRWSGGRSVSSHWTRP